MKRLKHLFLACTVLAQACNSAKDTLIVPLNQIPPSVVESIKVKYPNATDIEYSVLEDNKVYKADFKINGDCMSVAANKQDILNAVKVIGGAFTDSLQHKLRGTDIDKGIFSNYRIVESPDRATRHVANYSLRGTTYMLTVDAAGEIDMTTRALSYDTKSLQDLPERIQTYINKRNIPNPTYITSLPMLETRLKKYLSDKNELTFNSCSVFTLPTKETQYEVSVKYYGITDLRLIFDDSANLIWVGSFNRLESFINFDDLTGGASEVTDTELAYFTSKFEADSQYKGFTIDEPTSNSKVSLNMYGDVKAYELHLLKKNLEGDESWTLLYDANKNLVNSYYSGIRK